MNVDGRMRNRPTPVSTSTDAPSLPGQAALVGAALAIGILLLGIQLWILTVALDLFLEARGGQVWLLAAVSGLIFVGGLLVLWILRRRPRVRNPLRELS
jgi:hypothetical protein